MRVFCFLCVFFVPCLLCVTILVQRYCCWQEAFWTVSKKACASLLIHSTAAARKSEGLGSVNPIVSNHILSFFSASTHPFQIPPDTHAHTHTPEVWTPRLPSKEANISRTRPQSLFGWDWEIFFDDSRLYTDFDREPTDAYGMSWRILQHARIDCTCWWPSASTWLTMPAFGVQPALVCALIDQTRGVFFARAHTDKASETK